MKRTKKLNTELEENNEEQTAMSINYRQSPTLNK